ncbi:MAG: HAD hydrolase-like protein [Clostridiales bacterium]|nr:HAD hydrolase-like protein [Clostridiales bacterium]
MIKLDKLIIFDMDNTLIQSYLDFPLMKAETLRLLRKGGYEPDETLPLTHTMGLFRTSERFSPKLEAFIWDRVDEIEYAGLKNAVPEPGIERTLEFLSPYAHIVALTNTKEEAARSVLLQLGLADRLEYIMGRGGARELKPAPGGMLDLMARYPYITAKDTLVVGDALIDIQAARGAGAHFCAYNRSRAEQWLSAGYEPDMSLHSWDDNAARQMLALLGCEVAVHG